MFDGNTKGDYKSDSEVTEHLKQLFESLMRELAPAPLAAIPRLYDYLYPE